MSESEVQTEARRIAANTLINVNRDVVLDSLASDVTPEFEEEVYHEVRSLGFEIDGKGIR